MKEKVLDFVLVSASLQMSEKNRKGLLKTLYEASLNGYTHAYRATSVVDERAGMRVFGRELKVPIHDLTMALASTLDDTKVAE